MKGVRRLAGFILLPIIAAVSPLLALPAVTSQFGAEGWAAIALGQSLGGAAAVIVELGWALNGPQRVARAGLRSRKKLLAIALSTKAAALAPMSAVAAVGASLLTASYSFEAALMAVGAAAVGLTSTWFFIGTSSPTRIALADTFPKVTTISVAAVVISTGGPLWAYGAAVLLSSLASPVISALLVGLSRTDMRGIGPRRLVWFLRAQLMALSGRAVSALYIALPITLVGLAAPGSVALFATVERLQRMGLSVLQAVPNFLQAWVGRGVDQSERLRRARQSVLINVGLGLSAGLGFAILAPPVSRVLFSGVTDIPIELSVLGGLLIAVVCVSRATGNILLVALRDIRSIVRSAIAGAVVGVPLIVSLAAIWGPAGGLIGEIVAECTVLLVQVLAAFRLLRGR